MIEYLFGLVSMLADFVYEGGRSAIPAEIRNLEELGVISGTSEGLGYALRALSGVMADKLGAHYLFMFLGYSLVAAYPIAALWPSLVSFLAAVVVERVGKAIRSPARDALVASNVDDPGKAFAIIEVMDQVGAVAGPLTLFVLSSYFGLKKSMLAFFIPYTIMIFILLKLRNLRAVPKKKREVVWKASSAVAFSFLIGASFVQPLLSVASAPQPILGYAFVMLIDAIASLFMGKLFRKIAYLAPLFALSSISLKDWRFLPLAGLAIAYTEVVVRAIIAEAGGEGKLYGLAYAALGLGYLVGGLIMPSLNLIELAVYSFALSSAALFFLPKREGTLIPKL